MARTMPILIAATAPALLAQGVIELRGGSEVTAPIESIDIGGVTVGGSAPRTITWDRVKVITGEHASEALEYEEIAGAAWRARTRLARGDAPMAEPLYAWLFNLYQLTDSPTAALVADGYLQCLLDRGAQAEAVAPWLDSLRLDSLRLGGGDASDLLPALPPIFDDSEATRALGESGLPGLLQPTGGVPHALAWWYTEAARRDAGLPSQLPTTRPGELNVAADDLDFVESLVLSRTGDSAQRNRHRAMLRSAIDDHAGSWREAWARAAIGRSLLLEQDDAERSMGIVELLHVPARFASEQPALAALTLRDAASALRAMGDGAGAEALLRQFKSIDPTRPAPAPLPRSSHVSAEAPDQPIASISTEPRSGRRP